MKERDDTVYLRHILDAIARIEGYLLIYEINIPISHGRI